MVDYVAYYRVSVAGSGESLGLAVQQRAIEEFVGSRGKVVAAYREWKSGKRHDNRPELKAAVEYCRAHGASLVVSSVDRLARNEQCIDELIECGVNLQIADMPDAAIDNIREAAARAEWEGEKITQRITAALAIKKERLAREGKKLGGPRPLEALALANAARLSARPPIEVLTLMRRWRDEDKKSLRTIAEEMNRMGIQTGRGSRWYASTVRFQIMRAANDIDEGQRDKLELTK